MLQLANREAGSPAGLGYSNGVDAACLQHVALV